jgi:hypothetical protein
MKALQCIHQAIDIEEITRTLSDGEHIPCSSPYWYHPLPPGRQLVVWKQSTWQGG